MRVRIYGETWNIVHVDRPDIHEPLDPDAIFTLERARRWFKGRYLLLTSTEFHKALRAPASGIIHKKT